MALEIMEQVPHLDAIIVPVGGAGLIAGIAVAVKAMNPNVLIIVNVSIE
jgi:threonine dehydratase